MSFILNLLNEFARFYRNNIGLSLGLATGLFALLFLQQVFLPDSAAMRVVVALAALGAVITVGVVIVQRARRATNQRPPI